MPDSSLCDFDRALAESVVMNLVDGTQINFQFAPRITGESNSMDWRRKAIYSFEPITILASANGRKIKMDWEYVATDNSWTGSRIADNLRNLKSYFFNFVETKYPLVRLKYTYIIPITTDFRMINLNITYGPELIKSGDDYYPLYSKVSIDLELATSLSTGASASGATAEGAFDPKMLTKPLQTVNAQWY